MANTFTKVIQAPGKALIQAGDYTGISYARAWIRSRSQPDAVFIWIPKTAGTSVWRALGFPKLKSRHAVRHRFTNRGPVTFGHMDYARLVSEGLVKPGFDQSAFKFAIVRNPYDRAVSLFTYLSKPEVGLIPADLSFLEFCRRLASEGCPPIGLYNREQWSQCNPQARWTEHITLDYIGRIESIEASFEVIASRLGINPDRLPHENRSKRSSYQDYYCRESAETIRDFYKDDFDAFEYDDTLPTSGRSSA